MKLGSVLSMFTSKQHRVRGQGPELAILCCHSLLLVHYLSKPIVLFSETFYMIRMGLQSMRRLLLYFALVFTVLWVVALEVDFKWLFTIRTLQSFLFVVSCYKC